MASLLHFQTVNLNLEIWDLSLPQYLYWNNHKPWWAITASHQCAERGQVMPGLTTVPHTPKLFPDLLGTHYLCWTQQGTIEVNLWWEMVMRTWCAFQGFSFWLALDWSCSFSAHLWLEYTRCPSGGHLWGTSPQRNLVCVLCCCVTVWRVVIFEQFLAWTKTLMQMHHELYMNSSSKLL